MKEQKELAEGELSEERSRFHSMVIVFIFALLIGFVAGFLSHDHLARLNPERPVWKSFSAVS